MDLDGIHVEAHGPDEGTPIVLVHGAPDRSSSFRALRAELTDRGVVVYDRRGYEETLPDARIHVVEGTAHFAPRTHPAEYAGFVRATAALVAEAG